MNDLPAIIPNALRLHLLASLLFAAGAGWLGGPKWTLAVAVGAILGGANLWVLGWVARRLMHGDPNARNRAVLVLALKLGALCGVVGLTIWALPVAPIGFLMGFSAAPVGMLLASLGSVTQASNLRGPTPPQL